MTNNEELNNFSNEEKKKKKRLLLILFLIFFSVPIGFGIYALIPENNPIPPTPIITYEVKLLNNDDEKLVLSSTSAYSNKDFSADITINRSVAPTEIMPDSLSASDVLCLNQPINFTYVVSSDKYSAHINIPVSGIKGNITINVPLITPTDTFRITLKGNGGKFEDGSVEKAFDVTPGQSLNDLSGYGRPSHFREGYHFTHWELQSDRTQKLYEDDVIPLAPGGATYVANCELNEIKVNINPGVNGAFPGMSPNEWLHLTTLYDTTINQITGYLGEPTKANHKFLYYRDVNNKQYLPIDTVTIPDELDDNFALEAIYSENLLITLEPGEGSFPGGAITQFDTYRGITLDQLPGYKEPTLTSQLFTYWTDASGNKYYRDTVLDVAGSLKLTAHYSGAIHEHKITSYTVIDNHLYGICEECGAQLPVADADLSEYEGKFLMIENDTDSSTDKYVMHDIEDMENIIVTAEDHAVLEMYFISGEYDLAGSRGAGQKVITVNAHGLLNSEGKPTTTIDCTHIQPLPFPRFYLFVNFTFDNMIMKGEQGPSDFYTGLFASTITYNNCQFVGMQSLFSDQVVFNDCYFDAITGRTTDPEYSIYSYNSFKVDFNRCTFYSEGKALKIYSEGAGADATFKITDCNFTLNEAPRRTDKAPIEIDSTYQIETPYNVYITRCTYDSRYQTGLYHDSANPSHSNIIVTEE